MATIAAASTSIFTSLTPVRRPRVSSRHDEPASKRLEPIWQDPSADQPPATRLRSIPLPGESPSASATRLSVDAQRLAVDAQRLAIDAQLLAILDAPLVPGETALDGFRRKEHELGAVFATLSISESHAMHARLASPRADDPVAAKFARLVVERRARLLAFIAAARRRAALVAR